jgi:hypothetical protein
MGKFNFKILHKEIMISFSQSAQRTEYTEKQLRASVSLCPLCEMYPFLTKKQRIQSPQRLCVVVFVVSLCETYKKFLLIYKI